MEQKIDDLETLQLRHAFEYERIEETYRRSIYQHKLVADQLIKAETELLRTREKLLVSESLRMT
jgi:hypothetical protein